MRLFLSLLKNNFKPKLSLKEFMRRQQVLKLYRDLLKASRKVDDLSYRKELQNWIRRDFRSYQNLKDADSINIYITYGKKCLNELETSLNLAK